MVLKYMMNNLSIPLDLKSWPKEDDLGAIEYKSRLTRLMHLHKYHRLVTQMKWRLNEGADIFGIHETVYVIGLYDNGKVANLTWKELDVSLDIIEEIADMCNASIHEITFININEGRIAILYIKSNIQHRKKYPILDDYRDIDIDLCPMEYLDIIDE